MTKTQWIIDKILYICYIQGNQKSILGFLTHNQRRSILELREKCIEQALTLIVEQGLKFTMSDLAKSLGISKKTLYTLFDSKEAMFCAVADTCFASIKRSEKEILEDRSLSLYQRIRSLIIVIPEQYKNLNWYLMEELMGMAKEKAYEI